MEQACDYHGLDFYPAEFDSTVMEHRIDRFTLAKFLSRLQFASPQDFVAIMNYVLKDIFLAQGNSEHWVTSDIAYFEDFKRDLSAVGYGLEGNHVVPSVAGGEQEERRLIDELSNLLAKINPDFPKRREGAWEAYLSGKADGDRQAISSIRELFDDVIDSLSSKKTWKEKVAEIIGGKDAEVVASAGDLATALYGLQSKGAHEEPSYERAFFVIKTTEYSLHYLLRTHAKQ